MLIDIANWYYVLDVLKYIIECLKWTENVYTYYSFKTLQIPTGCEMSQAFHYR